MKYLVILGDGMADKPLAELGGKTPLAFAHTPNIDKLATTAQIGLVKTIPDGMKPASDVANLSVLGYAPEKYYSGRSPLEALSIGVILKDDDIAIRTNLVTLSEGEFPNKTMLDYSAGEISTEEAAELIEAIQEELGNERCRFYSGVSYRHCLVVAGGSANVNLTPPHDISDKCIADYLPTGETADMLTDLIARSEKVLASHPVNLARIAAGKHPATHIWFWGAGTKPKLDSFARKFGLKGAVISAVDLLKGIAKGTEMYCPNVKGATGTLATNWHGKVNAVKDCFNMGCEFVYLHMEAPDECGHQGDIYGKVNSIEKIDGVVGELCAFLNTQSEPFAIVVMPDHATPICVKTHTREPIPYLIYKSNKPLDMGLKYTEEGAQNGTYLSNGQLIMKTLLED